MSVWDSLVPDGAFRNVTLTAYVGGAASTARTSHLLRAQPWLPVRRNGQQPDARGAGECRPPGALALPRRPGPSIPQRLHLCSFGPSPLSPGLLAAQEKADLARTWGDPAPLSASTLPLCQLCPSPPRNTGQSPLSSSLLPLSLVPSSCCFTSFSSSAVLKPFPVGLLYTLENNRGAQRDFAYYGGN